MQFIYFTKLLQGLDLAGMARFIREAGLHGADLTIRPGYPVEPGNADKTLGGAVRLFRDHGLTVPLASLPTNLIDPRRPEAMRTLEACGAHGVGLVKIGYFPYRGRFQEDLSHGRRLLEAWGALAQKTNVKVCYHTHSGSFLGSNCAGLRLLLEGFDPHHLGAFVDTGHQALGGAPFRMALDMVGRWVALLAIKDVAWHRTDSGWKHQIVPAGEGIVDWKEWRQALADRRFQGVVSLHGEYETKDLADRLAKAQAERAFLERALGTAK